MLELVPEDRRAAAELALKDVFGPMGGLRLSPMGGGSSGALLYRAERDGRQVVLRIEGPEKPIFKPNPHRWTALRTAADAGVTPALWHLNEDDGVSVSSFVAARTLDTYPGGAGGLAAGLGRLTSDLQGMAALPRLVDYRELVEGMLHKVSGLGVFAEGALAPHIEEAARLSAELEWEPDLFVSAHNDPNPGNILFDGARLWLIDWESAYRNHRLVDLAIIADSLAATPELEDVLLSSWLGRTPDGALLASFAGVRRLTRLYYACFLVDAGAPRDGRQVPTPPPAGEIGRAIAGGSLAKGSAAASFTLGVAYLEGFLNGRIAPELRAALEPLV